MLAPQLWGLSRPGGNRLWVSSIIQAATASCRKLFEHWLRRAASRADWIAGSNSATRMPMIAITTRSSTSVEASAGDARPELPAHR